VPDASQRSNVVAPRLPLTVVALGLTSFFADVGSEMVFPLLPVFLGTLGASATFLGLVEGIADATASVLKLVSGYLADKASRRKPLVLFGYGIAAVVRPLVAAATMPWHVLLIRASDRVGKGTRSAPRDVLIASAAPPGQAGRAFGFHRAMDHAGAVVGPLVATLLLGFGLGLRTVFWLAAVPGVLSVLCVLLVREPAPPPAVSQAHAHEEVEATRLSGRLKTYLAILLLFSIGNSSDAFLLLRARDLGVSTAAIPVLWTALHVSKLASSYVGGGWSDRAPRARLIVGGWMVYAGTYLGLGFASHAWQAWLLFLVYGLYYGLTEPAEKALVRDLVPDSARGRAFGFYNFIVGISAIPASLLTGWVWEAFGPTAALAVGACVAALSALLLLAWDSARSSRLD
jgi:MFS family permease